MIKLIALISIVLMPIISVSTGSNTQDAATRSLDLIDENYTGTGGGGGGGTHGFVNGPVDARGD